MGVAIARELAQRGAEVELVLGPVFHRNQRSAHSALPGYRSAEEMYNACLKIFPSVQIAVMSAAVADYTPVSFSSEKIKKNSETFTLELSRTKDILQALGEKKKAGQVLVGFALENTDEESYARKKLKSKNADMIVLNSLNDAGAGFGFDTNQVTIFEKNGDGNSVWTKIQTTGGPGYCGPDYKTPLMRVKILILFSIHLPPDPAGPGTGIPGQCNGLV